MSDRSTLLLEHHLKELKLPSFLREYGKMAAQCAAEGVDHPQYLLRLAELELIDRHQRMVQRRIRAAPALQPAPQPDSLPPLADCGEPPPEPVAWRRSATQLAYAPDPGHTCSVADMLTEQWSATMGISQVSSFRSCAVSLSRDSVRVVVQ